MITVSTRDNVEWGEDQDGNWWYRDRELLIGASGLTNRNLYYDWLKFRVSGITVKRLSVAVLVGLFLVQIAAPDTTPSSITIDQHQSSVSTDQVVQFSATVKDSSGSIISSPVNWVQLLDRLIRVVYSHLE